MDKLGEASVEKSIFGIQTGFLGIWAHNETKLANSIALRSELGFDAAIFAGSSDATDFALFPTITIEPRYYYSLKKRFEKGKNTTNNSANFITMRISYQSDAFSISSVDEDIRILNNISFIPKWAIKRTIGKHFTYETGIGLGLLYYTQPLAFNDRRTEAILDLHLRVGFTL